MIKNFIKYLMVAIIVLLIGCSKEKFLNRKPSTNIVVPKSLEELTGLLDNFGDAIDLGGALAVLSADEYDYPDLQALNTIQPVERNAYLWSKELFAGGFTVTDWDAPYRSIFYTNVVLEQHAKLSENERIGKDGKMVKGFAHFIRAFAFYNLVSGFAPVWDATRASKDLGIPIRLSANVNEIKQRATLQETYDQIFSDLNEAANLLPDDSPPIMNRNRPSKAAVYALLSRIYLNMREYTQSEKYADLSLKAYDKLMDYNTISQKSEVPFSIHNEEVLLTIHDGNAYGSQLSTGSNSSSIVLIKEELLDAYVANDLRKKVFFGYENARFYLKANYVSRSSPFLGLATDEVYLIKAECAARRGDTKIAMEVLNTLLKTRWVTGKFLPFTAFSPEDALKQILMERRKELIWRGVRWQDIKRLNKEGANITLVRKVDGQVYTLAPNDPRYVFPIPDEEIIRSGLIQNQR